MSTEQVLSGTLSFEATPPSRQAFTLQASNPAFRQKKELVSFTTGRPVQTQFRVCAGSASLSGNRPEWQLGIRTRSLRTCQK